jgi:DNA-directed RNA polymerase subunit RPC12/RpoP
MPEPEVYAVQPEQKPPTVTKAPPAGRKFPCPQCGARLDFDPAAQGLSCPFCGFHEEIQADTGEVVERDYFKYLDKLSEAGSGIKAIADHVNEVKCDGCGATVILEDKVRTEQCPFCHTHLEGKPTPVEGLIEPESVLPFAVDLRAAREKFTEWLGSLWFAPSELTKIANLGQLTGVYVPYWTYDSMTYTQYEGQRGDNYTDYETVTVRDGDGNMRTERRPITRIAWTPVRGEIQHFFDDVLVCGSKSLPPDLIEGLEPWDLPELTSFQSSYLSSFKTERYAVGLQDGLKVAKTLIEPVIVKLVREDIGGDHQQISSKRTKYSAITFKHTLLPVWVAVYRYHEQVFQILVNGRTGKVVGKRPWSAWKIIRLVLLILALILMVVVIANVAGKKSGRRGAVNPGALLTALGEHDGPAPSNMLTPNCEHGTRSSAIHYGKPNHFRASHSALNSVTINANAHHDCRTGFSSRTCRVAVCAPSTSARSAAFSSVKTRAPPGSAS